MSLINNSIFIADGAYSLKIVDAKNKTHAVNDLTRIDCGEVISFQLEFEKIQNVDFFYLHTDLQDSWEFLEFKQSDKTQLLYNLRIKMPKGGYFHFRLCAVKGNIRLWENFPYRKLLIDPQGTANFKMYTLIPSVSGKVADWTNKLSAIKELGFNAVHLLPFTKMGSSKSPYSAADLFSIDNAYLDTNEDFDKFIDKAAELEIKICYDIVLNHISSQSNLAKKKAHWLVADPTREDGFKRAGCWHNGNWISWEDLVLINYSHPVLSVKKEIFEYMKSYVLFWIKKSEKCGSVIRLDNLHSSNPEFISWLLYEIKKEHPETIVLSEYFGSAQLLEEGVKKYGLNMLTANSWEYPFAPMLKSYLEHIHKNSGIVRFFLSPTSHDTGSISELFGSIESTIPRFFCCALMGTGQTGIVQGVEKGIENKINFIRTPEKKELPGTKDFSNFFKAVNSLFSTEKVFQSYGNAVFSDFGSDSLIVCVRKDEASKKAFLLAANFNTQKEANFSFKTLESITEIINFGAEYHLDDNVISVKLKQCGVIALKLEG